MSWYLKLSGGGARVINGPHLFPKKEHLMLLYSRITKLEKIVKELIMNQQELFDAISAVSPQLTAAQTRIFAKINELQAALATATSNEIPQNVADAIAAVQTAVAALDQLVPAAQ